MTDSHVEMFNSVEVVIDSLLSRAGSALLLLRRSGGAFHFRLEVTLKIETIPGAIASRRQIDLCLLR